jgi:hypothetical protein
MKVVIKKARRSEFYLGDGKWSTNRNSAKIYRDTIEALRECQHDKLKGEIILSFRDPKFDVTIPCPKKK